jgi:beta-lactamase regulating signal transducer with metallopeptidase domain
MFDILLEAALRATFIAAAVLVALWILRVRAPAVRHRALTVVMLAMLALPVAIAFAPDMSLRVLPPTYSEEPVVAPSSGSVAPVEAPTQIVTLELAPARSWNWREWLLAIYFAGAATLLARLAIGTARVRQLAGEATAVNGFLTSARIAAPFTFGLLKPRILLPEGWDGWSATRLAVVLDHERAHVLRRDPLVQWLALLNRAVFWFHPLAWWLERRLAALAEDACDATVLARGYNPTDYSQQLLELARAASRRPLPHLVGMPMSGSALPERIAKILDGTVGPLGSRAAVSGAAALATLAAVALGTVTLAQGAARPRNLLELYELALANDPVVRQAEAEYRAVAAARPEAPDAAARATADQDAARQELLLRVAEPYFDVAAAERRLALEESARAAASRLLEQSQRRFEVGLIPITELEEAQARFDQVVANELTAQSELAAAQQALRDVVGEPFGDIEPLVEDLPLSPPAPSNAEQWVDKALQQNPALLSRRIRAESADGDAGARAELERAAVQTEQATRAAYMGVVSEMARVRALEQSVRSNQDVLRATQAAFEVGTRSTVDVLTAESTLRQSETAYALSRYGYALNMLRLQSVAGGLTAQELERVDRWFE